MNERPSPSPDDAQEIDSDQLRLHLLRVADGNPVFAERLKAMIWKAYCAAECPCGPSEEGMFTWLLREHPTTHR